MRVYCDIDDILSETARALLILARERFGRDFAYEEVTGFNLQRVFSFTDDEMRRFSALSHSYEHLFAYQQVEGAVESLKRLSVEGYEIELVTGRPVTSHRATTDWLKKVGLEEFPVLYVDKYNRPCPQIEGVPRTIPLSEFRTRVYDFAVDDSPLALDFLATWPQTRVFVFDRPWNREYTLAPNMRRVSDWSELLAAILALSPR